MLVFPVIPENLAGLDDATLTALRDELVEAIQLATSGKVKLSTEDGAGLKAAVAALGAKADPAEGSVRHELARRQTETDEHDALMAAAAEAVGPDDEDGDEEGGDEDAEATSAGPDEDEGGEDEGADEDAEEQVPVSVGATSNPAAATAVATRTRQPKQGVGAKDKTELQKASKIKPGHVLAMDNVPGKASGAAFGDWTEFSQALIDRWQTAKGSPDMVPVGYVKADYAGRPALTDNAAENLSTLGTFDNQWGQGSPDELEAAFCAPCTPYYNLSCMNTTRRPVFNSLPQFPAPRGCVSIYPSPSLSDITGGYGLWTTTEENNPAAEKDDCATITCATPEDFYIYGVYRCLTVRNLLQMTYPELVEAYLNRLAAATARLAEQQLLNLMATGLPTITAPQSGFAASDSVPTQLLHFLTAHRERERWDDDEAEMWAPRWLLNFLKIDMRRRAVHDSTKTGFPSDGEVNRLFTDVGITPHWFIDTPTWGITFSPQVHATSGLVDAPTSVKVLLAPRGKFALMDRGELRIGVTGNNIYRDNASNKRNEFTFFFESFEGVVDTTSCPADILRLPVCFNGVQAANDLATCGWLREGAS